MTIITCNIIDLKVFLDWLRDRFKYDLQINKVIYYTRIETIMFLNALESSADRRWTSSLSSTYPAVIIFTWIFPPNPKNKLRSYKYRFRNLLYKVCVQSLLSCIQNIETYKLWKNNCCRKHRSLPPRSNPAFCSWSWTSSSSFWVPGVLFSAFFWYSPLFSFVTLILIRSFDVDAADEDDDGTGEDDDEEEETDDFVGSLLDEVLSILDGPAIFFFSNAWNPIILSVYIQVCMWLIKNTQFTAAF